jgi:hypothetical protein
MRQQPFGASSSADAESGAREQPASIFDDNQPVGDAPGGSASDQLAREIADIEAATAALRKAEPALESWTSAPATPARKPRPIWLLIGVLWLSTALVTAGAVVAIATLAG